MWIVWIEDCGGTDIYCSGMDIYCGGMDICRATTRPPRPSSTAECLRLIARLRGEQASAASWGPRPPFEATEMD